MNPHEVGNGVDALSAGISYQSGDNFISTQSTGQWGGLGGVGGYEITRGCQGHDSHQFGCKHERVCYCGKVYRQPSIPEGL